jgi:hypothetical protein
MKYMLLLVSIVCCSLFVNGQVRLGSSDKSKHEFQNQGEQENYWAEQLFKKEYRKRRFKKFNGKIIINDDQYQYGNQVLIISVSSDFKPLFEQGILYPDIIHGYYISGKRIKLLQSKGDTAKPNTALINY